jgi:pimeloyl-ACP methyl ester carboxylesterase
MGRTFLGKKREKSLYNFPSQRDSYGEKMKKRFGAILTICVLVGLICLPLITTVNAIPQVEVTRGNTKADNTGVWYTQYKFLLGGATDYVRIPDGWTEARLLVLCRGYSHLLPTTVPNDSQMKAFVSVGYATVTSDYGAGGYSVKEGVIRTHQLTEWFIDNFDFNGYVYLFGASMGGNIVLQLGATYPNLYDGVFDMFGSKNLKTQYTDKMNYITLNDADLVTALQASGSAIPPYPFVAPTFPLPLSNQLAGFRTFCTNSGNDIYIACGSKTPEERPIAYERISPTFSATHITIPTITLHGLADGLVPYSQSVDFKAAVQAAGHSDMYRLYSVAGKGHGDISNADIIYNFNLLVKWVETGQAPT